MKITLKKNYIIAFAVIIFSLPFLLAFLLNSMNTESIAFKIDPKTHMGLVTLNVKNLSEQEKFYTEIIQLEKLESNPGEVILGKSGNPIVKLVDSTALTPPPMGSAGLYHVAILFETREELATTIDNVLNKDPEAYSGSGDHSVSEAFYFYDIEGNGIELYYDRPRSEWVWENGKIKMGTMYIDEQSYIQKYKNSELTTQNSKLQVGHVHLKVGDIGLAKEFYVGTLGFDITAEMPTALFVSAGGYHHHLGMNTWESFGAGKRGESIGLRNFEIIIPQNFLSNIENQLNSKGIAFEKINNQISFSDPWGNNINLKTI